MATQVDLYKIQDLEKEKAKKGVKKIDRVQETYTKITTFNVQKNLQNFN